MKLLKLAPALLIALTSTVAMAEIAEQSDPAQVTKP